MPPATNGPRSTACRCRPPPHDEGPDKEDAHRDERKQKRVVLGGAERQQPDEPERRAQYEEVDDPRDAGPHRGDYLSTASSSPRRPVEP